MIEYNIMSGWNLEARFIEQEDGWNEIKNTIHRIEFFNGQCIPFLTGEDNYIWFLAWDENKIVGMLKLVVCSDHTYVAFVSIDENYRNQGIASSLVENLFQYADVHEIKIIQSTYTKMGWEYLQPIFGRFAKKYDDVVFVDGPWMPCDASAETLVDFLTHPSKL